MWICGLLFVIVGSLGDFSALTLAAQSIVGPVGAFTLVTNLFFASCWLKEDIGCSDFLGTICILAGSSCAAIFGDHTEQLHTVEDLKKLWAEVPFLIYATIIISVTVVMYILASAIEPKKKKLNDAMRDYEVLFPKKPDTGTRVRASQSDGGAMSSGKVLKQNKDGTYDINLDSGGVIKKVLPKNLQIRRATNEPVIKYLEILKEPTGVDILVGPEYPGFVTPHKIVPGTVVPYVDIRAFEYETHKIKFYQLADESQPGWIHNYDEKSIDPPIRELSLPEIREIRLKTVTTREAEYEKYEKIHPFLYCGLSGIFGGQNFLFGKMVAELLAQSVVGESQMTNPLTYAFIGAMLVSIFSQLHFMAVALSFFDALYVIPVFQCWFILISTLGGAAYFKEFSRFKTFNMIGFPIGIILTLLGVKILSSRDMSEKTDEMNSLDFWEPTPQIKPKKPLRKRSSDGNLRIQRNQKMVGKAESPSATDDADYPCHETDTDPRINNYRRGSGPAVMDRPKTPSMIATPFGFPTPVINNRKLRSRMDMSSQGY